MKLPHAHRASLKVALKVAYDGARFAGSQVQPSVRTVHGAVVAALEELGAKSPAIAWAGRTDAGVSAAANVAVLDAPIAPPELLPALTFHMDDVWTWAWAEVGEGFEPRHARSRWYRYHLRTPLDAKLVEDALQPFVGTHDFSGFARVEPGVNPRRTVLRATARCEGPFVVIDVRGESFLWNQVRRMVEAARRVAEGQLSRGALEETLRVGKPAELGTAPPEPLVLMDVEYDGLVWRDERARVVERLERRREDAELRLALLRSLRGDAP